MPYVTEETLTDIALERWQQIADPRLRQVMQSLIRHLHGFVRDIEPTQAEWFTAIDWLTRSGKLCDDKRQEFILASDVLGVSMLVDAINHRSPGAATPSTVEGPFHIPNSPAKGDGADMADGAPGEPCFITGTVRDLDGRPIAGAVLDVWQTDGEGLYEAQLAKDEPYMRAVYRTGPDGVYHIRTVVPLGYTIPMDGTVGELMSRTTISHMRPAHIHFAVGAPGFAEVVTHIFRKGCQYIDTDVVYGVKEPLITEFKPMPAGTAPNGEMVATPFMRVDFDFVLARAAAGAQLRGAAS